MQNTSFLSLSFPPIGHAKIFCVFKSTSIFQLERNAKIFCSIFHFGAGCKEILFSVYNSTSILHLGRGARILVLVLLLFSLSSSLNTKQHQSNLSVSLYPALHKGAITGGWGLHCLCSSGGAYTLCKNKK